MGNIAKRIEHAPLSDPTKVIIRSLNPEYETYERNAEEVNITAVCFTATEDLNRWMVANGWAVAYRRYLVDYVADEDATRRNRLNIWSGDFDMPWDWRAQRQNR